VYYVTQGGDMAHFAPDRIDDIADVDELYVALTKRKNWKRVKPEVLKTILDGAKGDIVKARRFRMVSEIYHCVENNYVEITKDDNIRMAVDMISLTLERLAAQIAQHLNDLPEGSDQRERAIAFAEMAYTSSILCNPLMLGSYAGLAFFYHAIGETALSRQTFIEYDQAEQLLLKKDEKDLSYYDKALKETLPEMKAKLTEFRAAL
jgi:hypothetical protein